jgi:hypothetical protein
MTCSRDTVTGPGGSTKNSCLDATAYSVPTPGTFGNLKRNALHGPGRENVNFSLFKNFPIHESLAFQLRGETFNLFNHPNPANPNTRLGGPSFGFISDVQTGTSARILQIAGKIVF